LNFHITNSSPINFVDPRVRLVAALLLSFTVAVCTRFLPVAIALGGAILLVFVAAIPLKQIFRRLVELNFFMLFVVIFLPLSVAGCPLLQIFFSYPGGISLDVSSTRLSIEPDTHALFYLALSYSREGLEKAVLLAFKANTIMITITGLAATMEPATFGKAMRLLGVPDKLVHIFLFLVRYLDLIGDEYQRLRSAMKLRAFQPSTDLHTLRSYGNLIGMVLVRSLERSDAILAAMKCRGFNGKFYAAVTFRFRLLDAWVSLLFLFFVFVIVWGEIFCETLY
jgi:cobalt/nickel transport system permease protein